MQFRTFQMSDYDAVMALWRAVGISLGVSDAPEGILHKQERDADLFVVCVADDGAIIGAVMGSYDGRRGWINHLAIDPQRQSQGLGAALLAQLEQRLRAVGCVKVNLLIEMHNARVQQFYERLDYQRDELIFMEKWL
ncbi:GNAT family acetyltransferase [Chloroflexia bacterium SDU3-3]|nr:GNAT family acetyltransferase [Chloroflexia bacterium SDU3-3]